MYYVEHLILNWRNIKTTGDIESDEFNDLLILERKIQIMYYSKRISDEEISTINLYRSGQEIKNRAKARKTFRDVSTRLGLSLGGKFTDDGYLDYMQNKYKLSPDAAETLRKFITSNWGHRIMEN